MPNPNESQCIGCGCEQEKVDAIVAELKKDKECVVTEPKSVLLKRQ